jgi:hypothetical protein
MDLTYQQVLADVHEERATDTFVYENIAVDDVDRDPYERFDYDVNEIQNQDDFNKFHGDRNKTENIIKPNSEGNKTDLNLETRIRIIPLNIDSSFRGNIVPVTIYNCNNVNMVPGTSSSDFLFNISKEYKNITSVKLTSMEFMNSFYTFSTIRKNTSFVLTSGATSYTFKLPDGSYSIPDIVNELNTTSNFTPAITGLTVTYNVNSNSFIFTYSGAFTITFPASTTNPHGNGLGYNLGFLNAVYSSSSNKIVSDSAPDLIQDRYVELQINDWNLVENQKYGGECFPVFAKVQLPAGSKNNYVLVNNFSDSSTKIYKFQQPVNIQKLRISLLDSYGNVLDMRGGNFSITLELEQVNNSAVYEKLLEL